MSPNPEAALALKVASLDEGRDGRLIVVSPRLDRYVPAPAQYPTLQSALDDWAQAAPVMAELYSQLAGARAVGDVLDVRALASPLPRFYQWADASTYLNHMRRIRAARGMAMPPKQARPVIYQSGSDTTLKPIDDIPLPDTEWGLDLEATICVVTDDVPAGTSVAQASAHVALLMLTNDFTFRHILPLEAATNFGPYQAKPSRPFAPVAVTPAALGPAWNGARLRARLDVDVDGACLGRLATEQDSEFGFDEILAHAAATRRIGAGSVIASGTVSNAERANGYGCLAEKFAVEGGFADAMYLGAGSTVSLEVFDIDSGASIFGKIVTTVAAAR